MTQTEATRWQPASIACRILLAAALMHALPAAALAPEEGQAEVNHRHHLAVFLGAGVRDEDHTD